MKSRSNPFLVTSLALVSATTLQAATLYWDGTDTTADADGGAGTWDTAQSNWDDATIAGNPVAWPSSGIDNDAVFGGTSGIVTVDAGGIAVNDLTFSTANYEVAGGPLTLNGAPVITNAVAATISSSLSGTTGLTKAGVGTLTLSGTNTGLSGTLTLNTATGSATAGVNLSGADADGSLTTINVNGGAGSGSYLGLSNASLASGLTINLTGQGGNSTQGTLRGVAGVSEVNGPVNINDGSVRISNISGSTSLTLKGAVTASPITHNCYIRFGSGQGVIFTNTSNNWEGPTQLGEGSVYFYPNTLPANTALLVGGSNPADFGTNGSFTRALGSGAGQIQFGKGNDGQRTTGFSARGGPLSVNLGGSGGDVVFLDTFAKTGATNATTTVTVNTTNLAVGMSVTGSGIPADTLINAVGATTITLNKAATTTVASNAMTFYAAANSARLNSSVFALNGGNADSALTFQNPLDLNGFNRVLQTSANTATLTGGLKNSSATAAGLRKTGAGTLVHDPGSLHTLSLQSLQTGAGTVEVKSGTLTVTSGAGTTYSVGMNGFTVVGGATFRLSGGTVNAKAANYVFTAGHTTGGGGNFIQDGGTFDAGSLEILNAYGATGITTINGGTFICGPFRVGQSTGTLNLNGGTLRANNLAHGNTTTTVNFNGGTLQAKANNANFVPTSLTNTVVRAGGAIIDTNSFNVAIAHALTEDPGSTGGGLSKLSTGILTLTGANTYTGATSVTAGTLALVGGSQTSPITVDSGAALGFTLGSPTTSTSSVTFSGATAKVTVTGTPVAATLMTASNITGTPVLDPAIPGFALAIEGSGTQLNLKSTSGSPFDTWATTTNGLSGGDAAATADPDNDGLDNAVEFVIGGQPNPANPNADSSALAPTISTDANNLIFTFRRTDLSLTQPGIVIAAEYGSDLIGWTTATDGVNGVAIVVTNDIEAGVDQVQVSIPKTLASGAKMFARLNVVIP